MVCSRPSVPPSWMSAAASRVDFEGNVSSMSDSIFTPPPDPPVGSANMMNIGGGAGAAGGDINLGFGERTFSAAGAAVLSVILVNPLDVAKTRLQAQAAGVNGTEYICARMSAFGIISDLRCNPSCARASLFGASFICPPDCFQYKGTLDVFNKIIRQEGIARLWRGTNAGLALAVPTVAIYLPLYDVFRNWMEDLTIRNAPYLTTYVPLVAGSLARSLACISCYPIELAKTRMQAFKEIQGGVKPPGVLKTLHGVLPSSGNSSNMQNLQRYRTLWTGVGAQLARDVPFSAICWSTLEPIRRRLLGLVSEDGNVAGVLGANFAAGFVAGGLAAGATCPLDVVKTRRQIEKDPARALRMTTRQTLMEVWRDGGMKGLFTGVGPRVARAGPSVGIVVSFYEVVKYVVHQRRANAL
ncbi:hypothetical protein MKX01_007753 [Papaver californicum]|nr:hypothetical protein MKX01_007753 [Papaver californicum]